MRVVVDDGRGAPKLGNAVAPRLRVTKRSSSARPLGPDFSGWNWHATRRPFASADV